MSAPRLVCLGNFTIDDVVLPDGAEQPSCVGGDTLYAALAARLFEPHTEIVAPVGTDLPPAVLKQVEAAGLSLEGMPPRALPTLHNRVAYDSAGGRIWTLYASEADFHALSPAPDDIPAAYRGAEAFLVLAMTLPAQEALVEWAKRETSALVALDPQEDYIPGNEDRLRRLIGKTDIFMPSSEEVRRLLGHEDWRAAAARFAELGPRIVVIKLGGAGCHIYDAKWAWHTRLPACPADAIDVTGAGDSFCGAFMAALLEDRNDLEGAARAGAVAASFAISDYGTAGIFAASPDAARQRLRNWDAAAA